MVTSIKIYTFISVSITLIKFHGRRGVGKIKLKVIQLCSNFVWLFHVWYMDLIIICKFYTISINYISTFKHSCKTFPASAKTLSWHFLGLCLSEIFETMHDNNLFQALHVHVSFVDFDSFSSLKKRVIFSPFWMSVSCDCEFTLPVGNFEPIPTQCPWVNVVLHRLFKKYLPVCMWLNMDSMWRKQCFEQQGRYMIHILYYNCTMVGGSYIYIFKLSISFYLMYFSGCAGMAVGHPLDTVKVKYMQ